MEIDHGFCVSIYTLDPSQILVEFCTDTAPYTADDHAHAAALITDGDPKLESPAMPQFHRARGDLGCELRGQTDWSLRVRVAPGGLAGAGGAWPRGAAGRWRRWAWWPGGAGRPGGPPPTTPTAVRAQGAVARL